MKILISSFNNIRFFEPYQIPISTPMGDPGWYHDYRNQDYIFIDKNGVFNGIHERKLSFPKDMFDVMIEPCQKNCPYKSKVPNCEFMIKYRKYLDTVDFDYIMSEFNRVAEVVNKIKPLNHEPEIVLIVYESASCNCAERPCLVDWFKSHGVEVKEWIKSVDLFS